MTFSGTQLKTLASDLKKNINTFIQQGCIKLHVIKSLPKNAFKIKAVLLNFLFKSPKKCSMIYTTTLSRLFLTLKINTFYK